MSVWLSSDWHLGHRYAASLRGYGGDVEAHDDAIIESPRGRLLQRERRVQLVQAGTVRLPGGAVPQDN